MKRRRQSLRTKLANAQRRNGDLARKVAILEGWVDDAFRFNPGTSVMTAVGVGDATKVAIATARTLDFVTIIVPDTANDGRFTIRAKSRPRT